MPSFGIPNKVCYKFPSLFKPDSKRNLTARLVWWLAIASGSPTNPTQLSPLPIRMIVVTLSAPLSGYYIAGHRLTFLRSAA